MNTRLTQFQQTEQRALQKVVLAGNAMQLQLRTLLQRTDMRKDEREDMENRCKAWEYSLEEVRETFARYR